MVILDLHWQQNVISTWTIYVHRNRKQNMVLQKVPFPWLPNGWWLPSSHAKHQSNKEQHYIPHSIWFALNLYCFPTSRIWDASFVKTSCSSADVPWAQSHWFLENAWSNLSPGVSSDSCSRHLSLAYVNPKADQRKGGKSHLSQSLGRDFRDAISNLWDIFPCAVLRIKQ